MGNCYRKVAYAGFEVLITADKRMQFQQNVASINIALVIVASTSTRLVHMRPLVSKIPEAVEQAQAGAVIVVSAGSPAPSR